MPLIGAHVSVAGGLARAFTNADLIGAEAIQIFAASPRQWTAPMPSAEVLEAYVEAKERLGKKRPVFCHAAYLVNLATSNPKLWHASIASLASHLTIASVIGAVGVIFHLGSATGGNREEGVERVAKGMKEVLKRVPGSTYLIMENSAGGGAKLGATPEEIGEIYALVNDTRVKICIDTQHAFAAGAIPEYTPAEVKKFIGRCNAAFGKEQIVVMHVNDSKAPFGSHYDRHENIGEGLLGKKAFTTLALHPYVKTLPWLLEVPGFADTGPDQKNVTILKRLCGRK